jgi:hypothetical protein
MSNEDKANAKAQYMALLSEANTRGNARRQSAMTDTVTGGLLTGEAKTREHNRLQQEAARDRAIALKFGRNTLRVKPKSWVTTDRLYMAALTIIVVLHLINDGWFL